MKKYPTILQVLPFICCMGSPFSVFATAINTHQVKLTYRPSSETFELKIAPGLRGTLLDDLIQKTAQRYTQLDKDTHGYTLDKSNIRFVNGTNVLGNTHQLSQILNYYIEQHSDDKWDCLEFLFSIQPTNENLQIAKNKNHQEIENHLKAILDQPTKLQKIESRLKNLENIEILTEAYKSFEKFIFLHGNHDNKVGGKLEDYEAILQTYRIVNEDQQDEDERIRNLLKDKTKEKKKCSEKLTKETVEKRIKELEQKLKDVDNRKDHLNKKKEKLENQNMDTLTSKLATAYANTLLPDLNESNTNPNPPMPTLVADEQSSFNPIDPEIQAAIEASMQDQNQNGSGQGTDNASNSGQTQQEKNLAQAIKNSLQNQQNNQNANEKNTNNPSNSGQKQDLKDKKAKNNHSFRNMFIITSAVIIGVGAIFFASTGNKKPKNKHKRKQ